MRTLMRQPFEDRPHRPCPETARQGYAWRKAPPSFARTRKIRCRRNRATAISENPGMDFRRYYARHSPETPGSGQKERVRHGTPRKEHGRTSRIQVKRDVPGRIDITACAYFPGEHFSNPCDHIFVRFPGIPLCGGPSVKADQGRACIQKPPAELLRSQGVAGRTFAYLRPYRETEACKGLHHGKSRIRVFQEAGSRSFFSTFGMGQAMFMPAARNSVPSASAVSAPFESVSGSPAKSCTITGPSPGSTCSIAAVFRFVLSSPAQLIISVWVAEAPRRE